MKKEKNSVRQVLQTFWEEVGCHKRYFLVVLFFAVLSYGYSVTHQTISIDDLRRDYYLGRQATKLSGRWGMVFWTRLMGATRYAAFIDKYFALVFLLLASVTFAALLHHITKKNRILPYTIFSAAMVTYPLLNEIWEYTGTDFFVCGNMLICGLVLIRLTLLSEETRGLPFKALAKCAAGPFILAGVLLSLVASSYEAGVFFYITAACLVLFLRYAVPGRGIKSPWLTDGILCAVPIALGVVLRFVFGAAILALTHRTYYGGGDTGIKWQVTLMGLIRLVLVDYVAKGLIYFPITIFAFCAGFFVLLCAVLCIRRKSLLPALLGVLTLISLFGLSLLQGSPQPYRTGQNLSVFTAFVCYLYAFYADDELTREKAGAGVGKIRKGLMQAVLFGLLYLCLHMSTYNNWILSLNNQRSMNEEAVAWNLGYELQAHYPPKPIIFVGWEYVGSYIESQMRTDPSAWNGNLYIRAYRRLQGGQDPANLRSAQTNVNSVLTWSVQTDDMMQQYFMYHGFDLPILPTTETAVREEAAAYAQEINMRAYQIEERENYIIVCLNYPTW